MVGAPLTYNPTNARKVGSWPKGSQRMWFGGGGKRTYFRYLTRTSFEMCSARKASLPKVGCKSARAA